MFLGLLKVGKPKTWENSKKDLGYIRKAGVKQFISTYNRVKDLRGDELLWGDEIEYGIFKIDPTNKKTRLSLRAKEVMDRLNEQEALKGESLEGCNWVPEYGAWMIEATPSRPYTGYSTDLLRVERSMRLRRRRLLSVLAEDEVAPTISSYFVLGAQGEDGTVPATSVGGPRTLSEYISDGIINPHPRFGTLTANIRQRRGSKVNIRVPLFRDRNTPEFKEFSLPRGDVDGCCGSDAQQLWRYGKGDVSMEKFGRDFILVGCSKSSSDEEFDDQAVERGQTLQKWLVDVQCEGCKGLFYRRVPGEITPDADWPRNGDIVVGHELQDIPGWIRLQNGYYLPISSECGKVPFLKKVSQRSVTQNSEMKRIGSNTPLFRMAEAELGQTAGMLDGKISVLSGSSTGTLSRESSSQASMEESQQSSDSRRAAIHMDAMAFGMGCCCLQITFQAKDIDESRYMYDQLAVMAPIMMALTASTPILKGRLADTDARWGVISESVDDRTLAERGRKDPDAPYPYYNAKGMKRMYKSRYDSISTYIYQGVVGDDGMDNRVLNLYNDIPVPVDRESYQELRAAGVDPALAQHIAHLFTRDPLVIFDGAVEEVDNATQTEHFESIQSTNWQTVRWKPPPPRTSPNDPHIGWRTEFRSMEIQLTDFENAAFTAFVVLLTRVILTFDLNLYIPISRVDANMQRAHSRNAAARGKFFFRRHLAPLEEGDDGYGIRYVSMFAKAKNESSTSSYDSTTISEANGHVATNGITGTGEINESHTTSGHLNGNDPITTDLSEIESGGVSHQRLRAPMAPGSSEENSYEEMTMSEIFRGKGDYFPGLIPLILAYLDHIQVDPDSREHLVKYLDFIERRATGELVTPATWMRNFVRSHPSYKFDSVVSDEIAYDLMMACKDIGEGRLHAPELLGDIKIDPIRAEGAFDVKLDSSRVKNERILELLHRYTHRSSFSAS